MASPPAPSLPPRYRAVRLLGRGGGGEVWEVEDTDQGQRYALKVLRAGASDAETQALVRELSSLSGLEGLGVPRVHRFGRLPGERRPYLLRELVEGATLSERMAAGASSDELLGALRSAAERLTRVHRGGRIHGDLKPDNLVVDARGDVTLVDLGLSVVWREGETAAGMTTGYGAPELRRGEAPSARSDVYALGVTLRTILERCPGLAADVRRALEALVAQATAEDAAARPPSADEFGAALEAALGWREAPAREVVWPLRERPELVEKLRTALAALPPGGVLEVRGRAGAGKSSVLRRLAWALEVEGVATAWIEGRVASARTVGLELSAAPAVVLIDDAGLLDEEALGAVRGAAERGAQLVVTAGGGIAWAGGAARVEGIPALRAASAAELVRQAHRGLSESVVAWLVQRAEGRPGKLRALLRRLAGEAVVSVPEAERLLGESQEGAERAPVERAREALARGRLHEAQRALVGVPRSPESDVVRARLALSEGDMSAASEWERALVERDETRDEGRLLGARIALRQGLYERAAEQALGLASDTREAALRVEARACAGVADALLGRHERARRELGKAAMEARALGVRRLEALALSSLALAHQRSDAPAAAREAYEAALEAAEEGGDAAAVATIRLNLAALVGASELATALAHLEAAAEVGQKAGRLGTVRQAWLNLANLDLALGRLARARSRIEALGAQRTELDESQRAQLLGLEAATAAQAGDARADALYEQCAQAYERLRRVEDAAEARVEGVLFACRAGRGAAEELLATLEGAAAVLAPVVVQRAPLRLARALVLRRLGDEEGARGALEEALTAAREAGQRAWQARVLGGRAQVHRAAGRTQAARRDASEALALLEEEAAQLPQDLREVYWDEPTRRELRREASEVSAREAPRADDRLERILAINRDLATVHELPALLERVLDHAIALAGAERGHVLLVEEGSVVVRASRGIGSDEAHRQFSRSIAEQAIATGEPVVSRSAREDERLQSYESVHLLALQSVACVPIRSPRGGWIGALYLETRSRAVVRFEPELGALRAFADQVAIAIENARLLEENSRRAEALRVANHDLEIAQQHLRELLEQKRSQLESARRDLKDTRAAIRHHFGYKGLVGTSAPMRRLYALLDRLKDTDVPVLITGESGTGKEMVARALHDASPRARHPFTGINCGAIPESLLESELFGHEKGAFTGADRSRRGLFRETDGGTLLLDEIGEMPTKMQAGLLRVLQERCVRPVGGLQEEPVDVRVVAATHRDLGAMVAEGRFREDLLYRLRVVEIHLPPLRERPEDIPALVDHFLQLFAVRYRRERGTVSREALRGLVAHPWPGNVRQLQNVLLNAWVLSESDELGPEAFDLPSSRPVAREPAAPPTSARAAPPVSGDSLPSSYADHRTAEKERILQALQACGWNRVKAAATLGIPRRTLYRRLHEYGIQ